MPATTELVDPSSVSVLAKLIPNVLPFSVVLLIPIIASFVLSVWCNSVTSKIPILPVPPTVTNL